MGLERVLELVFYSSGPQGVQELLLTFSVRPEPLQGKGTLFTPAPPP